MTRRRQRSSARTGAPRRRTPIEVAERATITREGPASGLSRRRTVGERTVVHRPVAIVVHAVADFALRQNCALTNDLATHASRHASHARRSGITTRRPETGNAFVRLSVAIVIQAIARFRRWSHRTHTSRDPVRALNGARGAFARVRATRRPGKPFVRLSVAIVVDGVASLGRWSFRVLTNPATRHANQRSLVARCRQRSIVITRRACGRTPRYAAKRAAVARIVPAAVGARWRSIGQRRFV